MLVSRLGVLQMREHVLERLILDEWRSRRAAYALAAASRRSQMMDKTALSYWFPNLVAAGLPVPRTTIIQMPKAAQEDIWDAFDGKEGSGGMAAFCDTLRAAMEPMGFPCFLRTDHTSGKHNWKRTCFVTDSAKVGAHVFAIAEFSECASLMGMPWDTWVVREFLPTKPLGVCPAYGDMPVCREFRYFVDGGTIRCRHPYWPPQALIDGGAEAIPPSLYDLTGSEAEKIARLAELAGKAVGGAWSVDILDTERGWFITDLAEASRSYHWSGCPATASQFTRTRWGHEPVMDIRRTGRIWKSGF